MPSFPSSSTEVLFVPDAFGTGCGLAGTNAAAEINGQVFWLSNSGNFYTFQGAIPQVIISAGCAGIA